MVRAFPQRRRVWTSARGFCLPAFLVFAAAFLVPATGTAAKSKAGLHSDLESPPTDAIDAVDIVDETLRRLRSLYLHPEAIEPESMLRAALQKMEHRDPSILVLEEEPGVIELHQGDRHLSLPSAAGSLREVGHGIQDAVSFLSNENGGGLGPDKPNRSELEEAAVQGVLSTIDRHTRLFTGGRLDEFNTRFKGTLVGIGARIGRRAGKLQIIQPFAAAPAGRVGLLAGDHITHVDGVSTAAMGVEEVVDRIRGPEGVPVVLTIDRAGEEEPRVFVIAREKVLVPTVESFSLPDEIGLLRIDHFSQRTSKEFEEHLAALQKDRVLRGLVLDVRGNTGGSMKQSARIANAFVEQGTLLRTVGRDGKAVRKLISRIEARSDRRLYKGPVVVLVDGRTSSGAEIVAGALKFTDSSLTIGSQTFGKGTVQKVYPLRKEGKKASLKLTVGRYLLPNDSFINDVGVTPDIATGLIWLDPEEVSFPDVLREPPSRLGAAPGKGGLDARRNPGGGWPQAMGGKNASAFHRIWLPRVLHSWDPASDASTDQTASVSSSEPPDPHPARASTAGNDGDELFNDMDLRLAHEVLREAQPGDRRAELLELAEGVADRWQEEQNLRLSEALALYDIPWSAKLPPSWLDRSPVLRDTQRAQLLNDPPQGIEANLKLTEPLVAMTETQLCLEAKNLRTEPVHHLRALLKSRSSLLNDASFLIADLQPGEQREWCIPANVPAGVSTRAVPWRLYLIDQSGPMGGPIEGLAHFKGLPRPRLALAVGHKTTEDPEGGNRIELAVQVKNLGPGNSGPLRLRLGRPDPEGSVERLERFVDADPLSEGAQTEVLLRLRVRDPTTVPRISCRLRAQDRHGSAATTVSLDLPSHGSQQASTWFTPATLRWDGAASSEAKVLTAGENIQLIGEVQSPDGLESLVVVNGGDQVYSQSFRNDPNGPLKAASFDRLLDLSAGPNRIQVRSMTTKGVERSEVIWVLGSSPSSTSENSP